MITIDQCKQQCNIEHDLVDFDPWFRRTIPAAVAAVKNSINRPMFETQAALDEAVAALSEGDTGLDNAIVISEDLKHAMLMLIGHWFENRESVSAQSLKHVPLGYTFLVNPYRLPNV